MDIRYRFPERSGDSVFGEACGNGDPLRHEGRPRRATFRNRGARGAWKKGIRRDPAAPPASAAVLYAQCGKMSNIFFCFRTAASGAIRL